MISALIVHETLRAQAKTPRAGQVWGDMAPGQTGKGRTVRINTIEDIGEGLVAVCTVLTGRNGRPVPKSRTARIPCDRLRADAGAGYAYIEG